MSLTPEREAIARKVISMPAPRRVEEIIQLMEELLAEIDRLREENAMLLRTILNKEPNIAALEEDNKALREALNDVDAKATLASQMCNVRAYADGFTVIADFARAALERTR